MKSFRFWPSPILLRWFEAVPLHGRFHHGQRTGPLVGGGVGAQTHHNLCVLWAKLPVKTAGMWEVVEKVATLRLKKLRQFSCFWNSKVFGVCWNSGTAGTSSMWAMATVSSQTLILIRLNNLSGAVSDVLFRYFWDTIVRNWSWTPDLSISRFWSRCHLETHFIIAHVNSSGDPLVDLTMVVT